MMTGVKQEQEPIGVKFWQFFRYYTNMPVASVPLT